MVDAANPTTTIFYQRVATDAAGRTTSEWRGDDTTTTNTFATNSGRLTSTQAVKGGTTKQHLTFGYDAVGNINNRGDSLNTLSENYTHDTLNRTTGEGSRTHTYDVLGNLTKNQGNQFIYYAGAQPHAVSSTSWGTSYTYDANGNQLTGDSRTMTWTSTNHLATVTKGSHSYTFAYDPNGARYKKTHTLSGTTTTTHYIGNSFEKITVGATTTYRHYIRAGKAVMAVYSNGTAGTSTEYWHRDNIGSITLRTDASANVIERLAYEVQGLRKNATTWAFQTITLPDARGFTGHEHLDNVGLIHMNGQVGSAKLTYSVLLFPMSSSFSTQLPDSKTQTLPVLAFGSGMH